MIVKLTVEDNDMTQKLEKFAKTVACCEFVRGQSDDYESMQNMLDLMKYAKLNYAETTAEQRGKYRAIIRKSWLNYVQTISGTTREYIRNRLRISIVRSVPDVWENGEAVYVLPTSYSGTIVTL